MANGMRRAFQATATAAGILLGAGTSLAGPIGIVPGPDNSTTIQMFLTHDPAALTDVQFISVDGTSTAVTGGVLIWDDVFFINDPPGAVSTTPPAGVNTSVLTWEFFPVGGFGPGETFSFTLEPDNPANPASTIFVSDLVGTRVTFTLRDASTHIGVFVDDPQPGAGLVLASAAAVAEPGTLLLLGAGLVGLAAGRTRRLRSRGWQDCSKGRP